MSMKNTKIDPMKFDRIRSSVLYGPKDIRLETRTIRPANADEVQVAIRTTTLCGSDVHYYNHFRNGDIQCLEPMTLGHESAGIVTQVGTEVRGLNKGDKVALEVGLPCGICDLCREGRYNICKEMKFRSSAKSFPHAQGTLQERINHPWQFVHKLPPELSLEMGALLEPLSVAIHAVKRGALKKGATVLVFGAGAVGLLVAAVLRLQDEDAKVIIADVDGGRLNFATDNGFAQKSFVVPIRKVDKIEEHLSIAQETAIEIGKVEVYDEAIGQVDAVFECTGVPSCLQTSIYAATAGGKVVLIGMGHPIQTLPISAAALREVDIIGSFRYANTYPVGVELLQRAQKLLESGQDVPRFDKLVTHRFCGLESINDAFKMAARTKDHEGNLILKVMVEIGEDASTPARL